MKTSFLLGGTGGQGVQMMGQLMAYCASMQGLQVTFQPSFSGNMRGAPSNCTVILSDTLIDSPLEPHPEHLVAFTQAALEKLSPRVASGGTVYYDSSQIQLLPSMRQDLAYVGCPATAMAEEMGQVRCANMIFLGFLCRRVTVLDSDVMLRTMQAQLAKKPDLLPLNQAAFAKGLAEEI